MSVSKQLSQPSVVPALFGSFLSLRIAITYVAFQSQPAAGTATAIAFAFLFVFLAWSVSEQRVVDVDQSNAFRWVLTYLAMTLLSISWSFTASRVVAAIYWAGMAADVSIIYSLMNSTAVQESCDQLLLGFVGGATAVSGLAWLLPTLSDLRIGDEEFLHPNALGYTLALATLIGLHLARRFRVAGLLAAFCGVTLLRTISKANIAGFVVALAYYLLRTSQLSRRAKALIYGATALTVILGWSLVEAYIDLYDQGSHIETLTGRTVIWSTGWEEALKTPWIGHGFYSFRFVIPVLGDFVPWQAHNELLQQFFSYGLIGVIIFAVLHWRLWRFVHQRRDSEWFSLASAIFAFVIIRGVADAERFDLNFPLWLMTLFIFVMGTQKAVSATA